MAEYILVGHIAADVIEGGRRLGGTVAYAAATAAAFGLEVGVLTSAAPDEPLLSELETYAQLVIQPADETTTFENVYTPSRRVQHLLATAADLEKLPADWRNAPLIHLAPIADEITPTILDSITDDSRLMLTPQGWMRQRGDDNLVSFKRWFDRALLDRADVVVISEEDIASAPDLEEEYIAHTRRLIVTQGNDGGRYYINGERFTYAAIPTNALNLTGAGDVFAASLFAGWHFHQTNFHAAVRVAARLAAHSVLRHGLASAPHKQEIAQAIHTEVN